MFYITNKAKCTDDFFFRNHLKFLLLGSTSPTLSQLLKVCFYYPTGIFHCQRKVEEIISSIPIVYIFFFKDMKIPLENTHVTFDQGDTIGEILAYITLTPVFLMVMYTTLILLRRDYTTFYALGGQLLNLVFNKILKKLIDQPRPIHNHELSDSGMPSNHSQFIGYFVVYYSIQFLFNSHSKTLSVQYKYFYSFSLFILGALVCFSRYYLGYHTVDQVLVGAGVGTTVGILWSIIDIYFGNFIGDYLCSIPLIHFFGVRHFSPLEQYLLLRTNTSYKKHV